MTQLLNQDSVSTSNVAALPRRERDRLQRRLDILQAAEIVFSRKGYHDASIEEIARAAEYGTGTVYLYFKDKEALYAELVEDKIRGMVEHIERAAAGASDPIEALRCVVRARMEFFDRNREFFRIYMNVRTEMGRPKGGKWEHIVRLRDRYIELITRLVRAAQRRGLIRKGDARQFAVALTGIMRQLTRDWLRSNNGRSLTDSVDFVADLFLSGALAKR